MLQQQLAQVTIAELEKQSAITPQFTIQPDNPVFQIQGKNGLNEDKFTGAGFEPATSTLT